jgi:glucose-1-phosphate thymidylyltransferase
MQAFILAGGFATRLWPLTEKRAKPLLPLAGKPIVSHLVEQIPADIPITVSTNAALKEGFEEWHKQQSRDNLSIVIEDSAHDDHKLGALGAVAQWVEQQHLEEDLLLLTGDNYCGFSMEQFIKEASPNTALLAAHDIGDLETAKAFGTVIVGGDGKTIEAFEEKPREPKTTLVSTGCSLLPASSIPILQNYAKEHPDNVGGIFEELLSKGKPVEAFIFEEPWFDIGSFEAYLQATKALVGNTALLGPNSQMVDTSTQGTVVAGTNVSIQKSVLENVVLFDDCTIEDCVLTDCIIDNNCHLKGIDLTGKMLRAGTRLT